MLKYVGNFFLFVFVNWCVWKIFFIKYMFRDIKVLWMFVGFGKCLLIGF